MSNDPLKPTDEAIKNEALDFVRENRIIDADMSNIVRVEMIPLQGQPASQAMDQQWNVHIRSKTPPPEEVRVRVARVLNGGVQAESWTW